MSALSIGSMFKVFQPEAAAKALEASEGLNSPLLTRLLRDMMQTGPERFLVKPSSADCLNEVAVACPHFSEVIDDLKKYVELALFGTSALSFAPILLTGDPGVGKTYFAKQLGKALGVPSHYISMNGVSAGWVLSGSAPTWHGAKHGKIAQTLLTESFANPLFVLDEIDKVGGDSRYDPTGTLLQLLEPETSRHFQDEFLDMAFDVSQVLWVATCNDVGALSEPLRKRMLTYEVHAPTDEQATHIAQRIFEGLCQEHSFAFDPQLSESVRQKLSEIAPRDMRLRILEAMGACRIAKRSVLHVDDIKLAKKPTKLGFTK